MIADKTASSDLTHTTLSVLLLALLIASSFWVLSPFLMAMLWATIVTVADVAVLPQARGCPGGPPETGRRRSSPSSCCWSSSCRCCSR